MKQREEGRKEVVGRERRKERRKGGREERKALHDWRKEMCADVPGGCLFYLCSDDFLPISHVPDSQLDSSLIILSFHRSVRTENIPPGSPGKASNLTCSPVKKELGEGGGGWW